MKKRFISLFLAAYCCLCLTACGGSGAPAGEQADSSAGSSAASDAVTAEDVSEPAAPDGAEGGSSAAEAAETAAVTYDYEVLEDGTANIYGYLADPVPDTLEIPAEIDGHKVTSIERLFTNEDEIRKVILPESLTVIGQESFLFAASVEEVEIRGTVTKLGPNAFFGCDALKSLAFKEGLTELADPSIYQCKSLEALHLPASLTYTEEEFTYKIDYFSSPGLTIYTPAGSAAEAFAKAQGLNVVND